MSALRSASCRHAGTARRIPHRLVMLVVESIVAVAGTAGAGQLLTGTFTPPVADLAPLGLSTWTLPGLWLFASVALPSGAAAWLLWRRAAAALPAVLLAAGALVVELVVQIPFLGPSVLQAVMGSCALVLAGLAIHARTVMRRPPT